MPLKPYKSTTLRGRNKSWRGGGRMVHWALIPAALSIGAIIGLFLAALIEAGDEKEGRKK